MQGLDDIPWNTLHHAYGTAEDVPELLRRLQTADPNVHDQDSPLWQLFGNIWHQGTVYEATSYAVPFLISLAADPATPDRVGILGLLAAIAQGTSFLEVHEGLLQEYPVKKLGIPGTNEFERRKADELAWVAAAHSAVAEGYDMYAALIAGDISMSVRWDLLAGAALGPLVWKAIARQMGPQALRMACNDNLMAAVRREPNATYFGRQRFLNGSGAAQAARLFAGKLVPKRRTARAVPLP